MARKEVETESSGVLAKAAKRTGLLLGVIGDGAGILVEEFAFESAVDQNGELAGGAGGGLRFANAGGEPSVEST